MFFDKEPLNKTIRNLNTENNKQRVEEIGIFFEKTGLPPMPGRVLAMLLLSEPPQQDFFAIQEYLQASKSAISNSLKMLQNLGYVDYVTFSGDRKRYFKVNADTWMKQIATNIGSVTPFVKTMEEILEERADSKHLDFNDKIRELCEFHRFLGEELGKTMEKWEKLKSTKE
jgi:DNA-binding transcriptional regulator GbsR (MarR family)